MLSKCNWLVSMFDYEKLRVYQEALHFLRIKEELMRGVARVIAADNHLKRAAESIPLNISHASNTWAVKERIKSIGHAYGSALECAAALDIFVVRQLLESATVIPAKESLRAVVSMLIKWRQSTEHRLCEERAEYKVEELYFFDHEALDVYRVALEFNGWLESSYVRFGCSSDLVTKIDKSATSMVLNIAEGNGRFSMSERKKFIGIALKATSQSASLLDVAGVSTSIDSIDLQSARRLLVRVSAMLQKLDKSL